MVSNPRTSKKRHLLQNRTKKSLGFTLIEVMVAVVIVASALAALGGALGQQAAGASYQKQKMLSHWVAMNKAVELKTLGSFPRLGKDTDRAEMAGQEWQLELETVKTPKDDVRQVEIKVRLKADQDPLATVVTYVQRNRLANQQGFTLIEVMVATAISAFILVASYSVLTQSYRGQQILEVQLEDIRQLQSAFAYVQLDIEQAISRPIIDEFGQKQPALIGGQQADQLIELTRSGWRHSDQLPLSNLQRVGYLLEDETLYRQTWYALDGREGEPRKRPLLDGVKELELEFLDGQSQWQKQWPISQGDLNSLPRAVKLIMELEGYGEIIRFFRVESAQ